MDAKERFLAKVSKNKDNRNWIVPFEKWPMLYRCFIILRGEINQF